MHLNFADYSSLLNLDSNPLDRMKLLKSLFLIALCTFFFLNSAAAQGVINLLRLRVSAVTPMPDGTVEIEVRGSSGTWVMLESSLDLVNWEPYPGPTRKPDGTFGNTGQINIYRLEGGLATIRDASQASTARFYRVRADVFVNRSSQQLPVRLVDWLNDNPGAPFEP